MEILICTYGRNLSKQHTYYSLPPSIQDRTKFVVQERDLERWDQSWDDKLIVLPDEVRDLPTTREWIQHNMGPKVVMMDDDLVFARRRRDDPTRFTKEQLELEQLFQTIEAQLDTHAHVGVSHREGANRRTEDYIYASRMMRVLAYRTDIVREEGIISNRTPDVEDFDVTLQLLRKGYPNCIVNGWVHNQSGSDQAGGCSEYRTAATHDRDVRIFAAAHHPFVKVVMKKTKDAWCANEDGERTDVTIQWKKAYASAEENPDVRPPS